MKILATDFVPPIARVEFAQLGEIQVATNGLDARTLSDTELLLVRSAGADADLIDAAPRLRIIGRTGAGYDTVDVDAATARGIAVLYAPGAGSVPVAEGTMALMLAATKRLGELGEVVRQRDWSERYHVEPVDLRGATLGVVGFGRIGQAVARLGRAFGMTIVASDPAFAPPEDLVDVSSLTLEQLVEQSDVISLHCELTDANRGMVNHRLLSLAKPGAVLINVARGGLIESEDTLLDALETGLLSAVALDVYTREPPDRQHPLLNHPRAICTPHSIGLTTSWNAKVFQTLAQGVTDILNGKRPTHIVNPEVLDPPAR